MLSRISTVGIAILLLVSVSVAEAGNGSEGNVARSQLGFSLGTPSAFNVVYTLDLPITTVSVSGMYWGDPAESAVGGQLGISLFRTARTNRYRALNLIVGTSEVDGEEWAYIGAEGHFSWSRFFVQPGIPGGSGDYGSPQLSIQLGFLWPL